MIFRCRVPELPFSPRQLLIANKKETGGHYYERDPSCRNKTLKLTNVLARKIDASELGNLGVILTQMQNFIKSHSAMPVGPVIQCVKFTSGPNPEPQIYFMMQVNQLIPRLEPGYEQDAVLRVKGCLYAHFTGPMDHSSLASQKLNIYAYEHEIELTGTTYSIYVNQDSENGVMDVFMETK